MTGTRSIRFLVGHSDIMERARDPPSPANRCWQKAHLSLAAVRYGIHCASSCFLSSSPGFRLDSSWTHCLWRSPATAAIGIFQCLLCQAGHSSFPPGALCHGRSVKPSSIGANKWQSLSRALCIALGDRVCRMPLACRMAPIVRLARAEASLQKLCVRHPLQQSRARVRPLRDLMGRSGNRSRFHRRLSVPVRPVGLAFVQTGLPSRRPWPMPGFQPPLALPCWVLR